MHLQTKSPFLNDGRLYITDDDSGIKDMVFFETLDFQPTMGWMYVEASTIDLFVDARYYEGVSKSLHNTQVKTALWMFDVAIHLVEAKQQRIREILIHLKTTKAIKTLHIPTGLVVGQVHELSLALQDSGLKDISLILGEVPTPLYSKAVAFIDNIHINSAPTDSLSLYITDHTTWMRDDHFLYFLWVDPIFGCMLIQQTHIVLVLPESLKTQTLDTTLIASRFWWKTIELDVTYVGEKSQALISIMLPLSQKTLSLSTLLTVDLLLEILTNIWDNTLIIDRSDFEEKRLFKKPDERREHTQAIQIIETVFQNLITMNQAGTLEGKTEKEIVLLIREHIQKLWWIGEAFPSIVSVGKNSAVPHHIPLQTASWDEVLVPWPILFDIGAISSWGRCSDFTRVLFIGTCEWQLYQDFCLVQDLVYEIHIFALSVAREWLTVWELDRITREFALKKAEEKKDDWEFLFYRLGYESFLGFEANMKKILYSHWLGHGVWIRIHEYPYFSKHPDMQLKKYMYITIEPGIYIPGYFWVRLENLYYIGEKWTLETDNTVPLKFWDT